MTDLFVGLHRGPIDHEASSVINAVANGSIDMGGSVTLAATPATELLPRVEVADAQGELAYGIAVGGDVDGTYGDGAASTDDTTRAVNAHRVCLELFGVMEWYVFFGNIMCVP